MRVAVLGGGLQGCCIALALAAKRARVVLFDRNHALLSRAAIANEGKIHLGYVYASDRSLETARTMLKGALAFAPFLETHLEISAERISRSGPTTYLVHRDSQRNLDQISKFLSAHHELLAEATAGRERDYFRLDLSAPPQVRAAGHKDTRFDSALIQGLFETQETAIEPEHLAELIRDRINAAPEIETCLGRTVTAVEEDEDYMRVICDDGACHTRFQHVVMLSGMAGFVLMQQSACCHLGQGYIASNTGSASGLQPAHR